MLESSRQNKAAWEYNAYDFWVKEAGTPQNRAEHILMDPMGALKRYAAYFESFKGIRIANICGSCGKKAVPLAVLGAEVSIFDISKDNCKYATEMAEAAGVRINYEVCDVLEIDLSKYRDFFDVVFMEGGVLHYFHNIHDFMKIMYALLKPNGQMVCSDFHPFTKVYDVMDFQQPVMNYFSSDIIEGEMAHARFYNEVERKKFPKCSLRKYTISEIINAVIKSGFILSKFDEHQAWTNPNLPGEFTLVAEKRK